MAEDGCPLHGKKRYQSRTIFHHNTDDSDSEIDKKKKNVEDLEEEDRKKWIKHLDGVNQSEKVARLKAERADLM